MLSLEPLDQEFVDQTYWKTDILGGKSVEDLMADYEWKSTILALQ